MKRVCLLVFFLISHACCAADPRVLVDGCELEVIAHEPEIVTPVGMSFDPQGNLYVVESHTHQRPSDYDGPKSDRIRLVQDTNGDGMPDRFSTFAEGFTHAMNVVWQPGSKVYVATRGEIRLLQDTDDDDVADSDDLLLRLETKENYPHNALSGLAFDDDQMFVGLGENMGQDYRLVGSDSSYFADSGGVGSIFQCRSDGSELKRYAMGFWNPFSLCLAEGRLWAVDNDPDASPPCRLIDVHETGDYGFRFEYGRAGVHPLHAWNGELPGTLPMICGTGEAPTAILFHRGYLWVTSWGDHRIERYEISHQPDGTPSAQLNVVVQGEADFRPTGMAVAPDGSLYFADWVDRSYPVHGKGRIWRLQLPEDMQTEFPVGSVVNRQSSATAELEQMRWQRKASEEEIVAKLREALKSDKPDVRLFAVRWIAEARLQQLAGDVSSLLDEPPPSERYYLAVLGAVDWLSREPKQRHSGIANGLLARELRNPQRSLASKAIALRLMSPDYKYLSLEKLEEYLSSDSAALRLEAVRTLAASSHESRFQLLEQMVTDEELDDQLRVEALVGLSAAWSRFRELFEQLAEGKHEPLAGEAQRELRLAGQTLPPEERRPPAADINSWQALLAEPGDAASGRRLFFGHVGPQCSACHRHGGRGGQVGPELTNLASQSTREQVIRSIMDPSAEVAPHYQPYVLTTTDGETRVGLRLPKGGDDGVEVYADASGRRYKIKSEEIEFRKSSEISIMPAGLEKSLTIEDLRDLVTFLTEGEQDAN